MARKAETYRGARRNRALRSDEASEAFAAARKKLPWAPRQALRAALWPAPKSKVRPYQCKPDSLRVMRDRLGKVITAPNGKPMYYLHQRKQPRVYPYHSSIGARLPESDSWFKRSAA